MQARKNALSRKLEYSKLFSDDSVYQDYTNIFTKVIQIVH